MSTGSITGAEGRDEFLQLLVTQLQNQDPLDPVKQEDFLSQLAQFSTLEQIEGLNSTMEQQVSLQENLLLSQQVSQAGSLIGKSVVYKNGAGETVDGVVDSVRLQEGGLSLRVGLDEVNLSSVSEIRAATESGQIAVREPTVIPETTDNDAVDILLDDQEPNSLIPETEPQADRDVFELSGAPANTRRGATDSEGR